MQAEQSSTTMVDRGRTARLVLLASLLILLIGAVALLAYYLTSEQPFTHLPRIVSRDTTPRYLFSMEDFAYPTQVSVSSDARRIYVLEKEGERAVQVFDRQGTLEYTLAPPNTWPNERVPAGIATTPDGRVLISDMLRGVVDVYSPEGDYQGAIGSPEQGGHWAPLGVAVDAEGNTYVSDGIPDPPRVVVFDAGYHKRAAYVRQPAHKNDEVSVGPVAVDRNGRLFVSNILVGTVDVFGPDGQLLSAEEVGNFSGGLRGAVWVDSQNRLYAVDSINAVVEVYDLDTRPGRLLFKFGGENVGGPAFSFPVGVAADVTGRVYVTDTGSKKVHVLQY